MAGLALGEACPMEKECKRCYVGEAGVIPKGGNIPKEKACLESRLDVGCDGCFAAGRRQSVEGVLFIRAVAFSPKG